MRSTPGSSRPPTNSFDPSSRGRAMWCCRSSHWRTRASPGRPVYSKGTDDLMLRDHAGAGPREADRDRAGRVARGAYRHRREAGRVFVASVVRRRRARRHRVHDVPVHRGRGVPGPRRITRPPRSPSSSPRSSLESSEQSFSIREAMRNDGRGQPRRPQFPASATISEVL